MSTEANETTALAGEIPPPENEHQTEAVETEAAEQVVQAEPEPEPKPVPEKKKADPLIAELTAQRARRREAEERAAKAEREAADYRAMLERLSKGETTETPAREAPKPVAVGSPEDEVERRAEYKLFLRDVESLKAKGSEAFGPNGFSETIQTLAAYGADNDEFVRAVMDVDRANAHELLHEVAQDPARAIGLVNMTPHQRIAELTRMSVARQSKAAASETPKAAVKPAAISSAPKPAPTIAASARQELPSWSDKKDEKGFDQDFDRWAKRFQRR